MASCQRRAPNPLNPVGAKAQPGVSIIGRGDMPRSLASSLTGVGECPAELLQRRRREVKSQTRWRHHNVMPVA